MNFLKNNFLLLISLGFIFLSYGENKSHLLRFGQCIRGPSENICDMSHTELSGLNELGGSSNFPGFRLNLTRISKFDFTSANLQNSIVVLGRNLQFVNFTNTDLRGTHIRSEVRIDQIGEIVWTGAKYNEDTVFPTGFNPEDHGMVFVKWDCIFNICL